MGKPKVSVITVVFNDVSHIEETIKNVLKQTYSNMEYIIIDGNSTDGTLDVIKRYDDRLIYISEKDRGIYDAMQKGANIATGEWIIYRNCGDYFFSPSSISDVFDKCELERNIDFVTTDIRFFKQYGYKDAKPNILKHSYYEAMPFFHPSTYIRRDVQIDNPYHLEYKNSADYCFFVETLFKGAKYKYIDVITSLFDNGTGTTASSYDHTVKENIDIVEKFGAPANCVRLWKKRLFKIRLKKVLRKYLPFFEAYQKWRLGKDGWVNCNLKFTLKNI